MSTSYLETIRAAWKAQLEAIDGTGDYRNDVKAVYEDVNQERLELPCIELLFGESTLFCEDQAWTVYNMQTQFFIYGNVTANSNTSSSSKLVAAMDSLVHDIFRVIAANQTANVLSTPSWLILAEPNVTITPLIDIGNNRGWFLITGYILIRSMDNTFS